MNSCQKCERKDRAQYFKDFGDKYEIEFTTSEFDRVDFYQTSKKYPYRTYVGELKGYFNPQYPRFSNKFPDYQIDFTKLYEIVKTAKSKQLQTHIPCIPLLVVYFTNELVVWDLSKIPFTERAKWVVGNKRGIDYGDMEYDLQTYLNFDEAVYRKPYNAYEN